MRHRCIAYDVVDELRTTGQRVVKVTLFAHHDQAASRVLRQPASMRRPLWSKRTSTKTNQTLPGAPRDLLDGNRLRDQNADAKRPSTVARAERIELP